MTLLTLATAVNQVDEGGGDLADFSVIGSFTKLAVSCVVVVILIWITVYVLRVGAHRRTGSGVQGSFVEVLSRQYLAPQKALYLVRIGGKHLVIGESPAGFQKITEVEEDEIGLLENTGERLTGFPALLRKFQKRGPLAG